MEIKALKIDSSWNVCEVEKGIIKQICWVLYTGMKGETYDEKERGCWELAEKIADFLEHERVKAVKSND